MNADELTPSKRWELLVSDEAATERFGACLAAALPCPAAIALCGTLGAGKTRLVQAIAAAAGVSRQDVVSPTFVLCQQYHGRGRTVIHHIDAYRIGDEDEWFELGIAELLDEPAWVIIEWADRYAALLPDERLEIELLIEGQSQRRILVTATGPQYVAALDTVRAQFDAVTG